MYLTNAEEIWSSLNDRILMWIDVYLGRNACVIELCDEEQGTIDDESVPFSLDSRSTTSRFGYHS